MRDQLSKATEKEIQEFLAVPSHERGLVLTAKLREARRLGRADCGDRLEILKVVVRRLSLLPELERAKLTLETEDARAQMKERKIVSIRQQMLPPQEAAPRDYMS